MKKNHCKLRFFDRSISREICQLLDRKSLDFVLTATIKGFDAPTQEVVDLSTTHSVANFRIRESLLKKFCLGGQCLNKLRKQKKKKKTNRTENRTLRTKQRCIYLLLSLFQYTITKCPGFCGKKATLSVPHQQKQQQQGYIKSYDNVVQGWRLCMQRENGVRLRV